MRYPGTHSVIFAEMGVLKIDSEIVRPRPGVLFGPSTLTSFTRMNHFGYAVTSAIWANTCSQDAGIKSSLWLNCGAVAGSKSSGQ